VDINVLIIQK